MSGLTLALSLLVPNFVLFVGTQIQVLDKETGQIILKAPEPRPEDFTRPNVEYRCELETVEGSPVVFEITWFGSRGYKDPKTGVVKSTSEKVIFDGVNKNWFSRYELVLDPETARIDGRYNFPSDQPLGNIASIRKRFPLGGHIRIRFLRTEFFQSKLNRVGITIHSQDTPERLLGLGYCNRSFGPQVPLTAAEVSALEDMK